MFAVGAAVIDLARPFVSGMPSVMTEPAVPPAGKAVAL
jgi:hypothetical protein